MSNDKKIVADAKEELKSSDLVQKVTQIDDLPVALRAVMHVSAASHPVTFWKAWFFNNKAKRYIKKRDKQRDKSGK